MSCHAILKNLYEPRMDVILTIGFKITAENEITNHCFTSYFADEDLYRRFVKHNYVLSFIHYHGMRLHCVFTVNSSVNAARSSLKGVCRLKFHGKGIKLLDFSSRKLNQPLWCSRVELKVSGSSPT